MRGLKHKDNWDMVSAFEDLTGVGRGRQRNIPGKYGGVSAINTDSEGEHRRVFWQLGAFWGWHHRGGNTSETAFLSG